MPDGSHWDDVIAGLAAINGGGRTAGEPGDPAGAGELPAPEVVALLEIRRQAVAGLEALAAVMELVDEQLART